MEEKKIQIQKGRKSIVGSFSINDGNGNDNAIN